MRKIGGRLYALAVTALDGHEYQLSLLGCAILASTWNAQGVPVREGREIRQSRVTDPASGKLQLLRVVVDRGKDSDTVVTVYRTSKVRKYWRGA